MTESLDYSLLDVESRSIGSNKSSHSPEGVAAGDALDSMRNSHRLMASQINPHQLNINKNEKHI